MAYVKCIIFFALMVLAMVAAVPLPEPFFFGPKHEHHIIHVPENVHTINHHIIHKVHVPFPVYIEKDHHHGWH